MMNKSSVCFLILLLIWINSITGQEQSYLFTKLPADLKFSNVGVSDMLEDHKGFLWIATWSGLAKYDGYNVKMYRQTPDCPNGLKSNKINHIYEDSVDNLWIATSFSGFYRYNRDLDNFEQFAKDPSNVNSLSNNNVHTILEDQNGLFWIGTEYGLNCFDPQQRKFIHYFNDPNDNSSIGCNFIYSLAQLPDGSLWIGTKCGFDRMVKNGNDVFFIHYNLADLASSHDLALYESFVYKIIPSQYDPEVLWVCTNSGLYKVRYSPNQARDIEAEFFNAGVNHPKKLSHLFIRDVLEEDSTHIWVATLNGLNRLHTPTNKVEQFTVKKNNSNSLTNNIVLCLEKDRTNHLWIGLDEGINYLNLNGNLFQNIKEIVGEGVPNNVNCMVEDSAGIWAGMRGRGISFLPFQANGDLSIFFENYKIPYKKKPKLSNFITSMSITKEGQLWAATNGAGVFVIDKTQLKGNRLDFQNIQYFTEKNQLKDDYVMTLTTSTTGDIWLGYWDKGLSRYDSQTGAFHHYQITERRRVNLNKYPIVHLLETVEAGQSYLWVGTRGGGAYQLALNAKKDKLILKNVYNSKQTGKLKISSDFINCFLLDHTNRLWIGTDIGVNRLENDGVTIYSEKDGLKNDIIQSLLEDADGNIWISTQEGISCLSMNQTSFPIKNFDIYDGLHGNYFSDDAGLKTKHGQLIFGGANGLSIFRPSHIKPDTIIPKVVISDFRLFNKSVPIGEMEDGRTILTKNISETTELDLSHTDNVFSLGFTGLYLGKSKKLTYAFQLEGFDPDWVQHADNQKIAHYTNLPYKQYNFKVKVANSDGVWSDTKSLKITIHPPFWLTSWAYLTYALLFGLGMYAFFKATRFRAEMNHRLELERLEHEKITELNQMKLRFFTNVSHELRTPLTLIISPLKQLLEQQKDPQTHPTYIRMHHNANRLLQIINQLLDIRKREAGLLHLHVSKGDIVTFSRNISTSFQNLANQKNIAFSFYATPQSISAWFDHHQLETVLYNLLSNAFKFTKEHGSIILAIKQNEQIEISIKDTGVGIPKEQLNTIFERFYQVENTKEKNWARKSGTGIGLFLVKTIVEQHHGTIAVQSKEEEGTTFTIFLKTGKTHFTQEELMPTDNTFEETPEFALTSMKYKKIIDDIAEKTASMPDSDQPHILLVEDNADIRAYIRENLEKNYQITEASDGKEGLEIATKFFPDLIVADIAMPRMDGIEMCGKIKKQALTSHIPIILLTARTSLVFQVDGLEMGADDYITKPFHMKLLVTRIKNLIDNRKRLHARFTSIMDINPSELDLSSFDEHFLSELKTQLENCLEDRNLSVEQLAEALTISRMQLYHKLKAITGKTPKEVIRDFQLKRAAQLLETKRFNVSEVTYQVGYNDLKSFRNQFKKQFGVTPSVYSKQNK